MNHKISKDHMDKFRMISYIDYENLKKKTDKFRLNVDLKNIRTYDDLKQFYINYIEYLSVLSKYQIDLILLDKKMKI